MEQFREKLTEWANEMEAHSTPVWETLPDIDLYMDQVIAFMEKHLNVFIHEGEDKLITPSMINNYVKLGLIPPPVKKKYSGEHIAYLMTVCMLKQVLPINDIINLVNNQKGNQELTEVFNLFGREQDKALHDVANQVQKDVEKLSEEDYKKELSLLALKLAVTANANKIAAENVLYYLEKNDIQRKNSGKNK